MQKSVLKKGYFQKPQPGLGFCIKTTQAKLNKRIHSLLSRKFDEDLKQKTLTPQGEMWLSVLSFFNKAISAGKKTVQDLPEDDEGYFQKNDQRFYFITKEKVILKDKILLKDPREYITYISENPSHSIGLNLTTFREGDSLIICDIDDSFVGNRIIEWAKSSFKSDIDLFRKTFGNPILIKTPSDGHLHLIYKCPCRILPNLNKVKICSRLGFSIEYTFTNIELYSLTREILLKPNSLSDLSTLPEALFPYNYFQKPGFESLAQGMPLNPNRFPKSDFIPEGRRNNTLFNFFRVDNFSTETVLATNKLLCEPPLPDEEVLASCERRFSKLNYRLDNHIAPDQMRKPNCEFNAKKNISDTIDSDFRIRENENLDLIYTNQNRLQNTLNKFINKNETARFTEFYKFNLERVIKAISAGTNINTMLLVAFLEFEKNIFIDSASYHGKSTESFVIEYFLKYCNFGNKIMYISTEDTWYFWDEKVWQVKSDIEIDGIFQNFISTQIRYGSLESRFTKNGAYKTILQSQTTFQNWPCRIPRGINFENGIAVSDKAKNLKLIPHNPSFYHRAKFPCNFNPYASLTPIQMRFLSDLAGDSVMGLNIIRYVLFLAFVSNVNQVGVYLNSEPGGSKSTLVRLIQAIFKNSIVPLSLNEIKKGNTFQHDFAANKKGLVIAELSPNNTKNESFIQWTKSITGGDSQVAQKKFGNFYEHGSTVPLFIMTSNYSSSSMPMWQDEAIKDRIIDVQMPKIQHHSKIKDLETWVVKNLESLVNWVLQLPIDYVNDFTRVNELNNEFSCSTNAMQSFFKQELVFIPNPLYNQGHGNQKTRRESKFDYVSSIIPYRDLYQNFKTFLQNNNYESFIKEYYESNANIKTDFLKTLQQTIPRQRNIVVESRNNEDRGFFHVMFRERLRFEARKTRYGSVLAPTVIKQTHKLTSKKTYTESEITYVGKKQYSLIEIPQFTQNLEIRDKLLTDPLQYSGFCTHEELRTNVQPVLIQTKPEKHEDLREKAYICASLVANNSCKKLIETYSTNCSTSLAKNDYDLPILPNLSTPLSKSDYHLSPIVTKGPKLYETENFQKYGTLTPTQLTNLNTLSNTYQPTILELPKVTGANYNPRNPNFDNFEIYAKIYLFFAPSINVTYELVSIYETNLKPEVFLSPTSDLVYDTFAPNDIDEKAFRELLRETLNLFVTTLGMVPNQESFVFTVLTKMAELDFYPTLLFDFSIWTKFLIQQFPKYEPLFSSWSPVNNEDFFAMYRNIENFYFFDDNTYQLSVIKNYHSADYESLAMFRKKLLNKNQVYSDFYKDRDFSSIENQTGTNLNALKSTYDFQQSKRQIGELVSDDNNLPSQNFADFENEDDLPSQNFADFEDDGFIDESYSPPSWDTQTANLTDDSAIEKVNSNTNELVLEELKSESDFDETESDSTFVESQIPSNFSNIKNDGFIDESYSPRDLDIQTANILDDSAIEKVNSNTNELVLEESKSKSDFDETESDSTKVESQIPLNVSNIKENNKKSKSPNPKKKKGRPKGSKNKPKSATKKGEA